MRKKVTIVYVCEREGKAITLTICIYQSFSSQLITVQTSLCSLKKFFASFLYNVYSIVTYIFTKLCKYSARNADRILRYHKYNVS